jgi:TPR repeat protein
MFVLSGYTAALIGFPSVLAARSGMRRDPLLELQQTQSIPYRQYRGAGLARRPHAGLTCSPSRSETHPEVQELADAVAQYNLGIMYHEDRGVAQNYAVAIKWFRLAAEQDRADAQFRLGIMYRDGVGVPQDYVQAYMWFNLAVSQFPPSERQNRDIAVKDRDLTASKMTRAQIAEAQKLTRGRAPSTARSVWVEVSLKKIGGTFVVPVEVTGAITLDERLRKGSQ